MERDDIDLLVDLWQNRLNLSNWRIQVRVVKKCIIEHALMEVTPTRDRRIAVVSIREDVAGYCADDLEPLLVHELVHLIYDPLAEEHDQQLKFADGLRDIECKDRFCKLLERAVEHTTLSFIVLSKENLN